MDERTGSRRGRTIALSALLLAALALGPLAGAASAADVGLEGTTLVVVDDASEANAITIEKGAGGVDVVGALIDPKPGGGCSAVALDRVRCPDPIGAITIDAGGGDDMVANTMSRPATIDGGGGADDLAGGSAAETIRGGDGDDRIAGGGDVDVLSGGAGDDFISTRGTFTDKISCGAGSDTVYADDTDQVADECEHVRRPTDVPGRAGVGAVTSPPVQVFPALQPGACDVVKNGTPQVDTLDGTPGGDTILGFEGDDLLRGLDGDDCLFGGPGDDEVRGGTGDDFLSGERGDDRLAGEAGDDRLTGGGGGDRLSGAAGADTMAGRAGRDRIAGGAQQDLINGGSGPDRLAGGSARDGIAGGRGKDRIAGDGGRDRIAGGKGADRIDAHGGGRDRVSCGRGHDSVRADRRDRVAGDCENVLLGR